jgi:hypothetical protein
MKKDKNDQNTAISRVKKGQAILTGNPADIVVVKPEEKPQKFQTEDHLLERVVSLVQRRKRAISMKRREPKMVRRRQILKTRLASKEKLMQRAMRMAKQMLRRKMAGSRGSQYQYLGPTERLNIDKMIEPRAKAIKKIAMRLLPRIQSGERKRLSAVQTGKSTKGVYKTSTSLVSHYEPSLKSELIGETISKEDLNQLFSLYEAGFMRNLGSVVTAPVRAAGIVGKIGLGAAALSTAVSTPRGAVGTLAAGTTAAAKKMSEFGKIDKSKDTGKSWSLFKTPQEKMELERLKQSRENTTQQKIVTKQKKLELASQQADLEKKKQLNLVAHKEWDHEGYLTEKAYNHIEKKALENNIPFDALKEVFERGIQECSCGGMKDKHQVAMQRVNSFIAQGKTYREDDSDIVEKRGLWANIHAKRARIKAGSGERMRKPGSEGAPTKQNFVDASEEVKRTPAEKFKAGLKKAGYDPDAGAKRLLDLIAKQKKDREEFEKKYKSAYEEVDLGESFIVDRASGYSGVFTAKDLGIKMQGGFQLHPSVTEEGGAGDEGTSKLVNKYKKDTPGEALESFMRQMRAKRKANTPC